MKTLTLVSLLLVGVALLASRVEAQIATHIQTYEKDVSLPEDWVGRAMAIKGDSLYVSASYYDDGSPELDPNGAIYVFDINTGEQLDLVIPNPNPDPNPDSHPELPPMMGSSPHFNDRFGQAIAVKGNRLVVGAPRNNTGAKDAGVVYVFHADTGDLIYTIDNPLLATNPAEAEGDGFGTSIAFVGDDILVGAPYKEFSHPWMGTVNDAGGAYLFEDQIPPSGESPQPKCTYDNPLAFDEPNLAKYGYFGAAVAAVGTNVLVGASTNDYNGVTPVQWTGSALGCDS